MSFFEFPHTRTYDHDLGWVIKIVETLKNGFEEFVALNSLTFADPILHDITQEYAKNTIVLDSSGTAYLSLKPVPPGILLDNSDYWLMIFDFEAFRAKVNKNFTVRYYRDHYTAVGAILEGAWLTVDDVLYKATTNIGSGEALEVGVNITHFTIEDFLKEFITTATNLINQYKAQIDASEIAYKQELLQEVTTLTDSLQAQLDAAISGVTVDSEVINARVGQDGTTYNTLGEAIRTQFEKTWTDDVIVDEPLNVINGGYIDNNNGQLVVYSGWKYCDFIALDEDADFIIPVNTVSQDSNKIYNAFYIDQNTFLSSFTANGSPIRVPIGAKYLRMSTPTGANISLSVGKSVSMNALTKQYETDERLNTSAAYGAKYGIKWEVGGLNTTTGVNVNNQTTRLRSGYTYALEDYIIITKRVKLTDGNYYKIFYWNNKPFDDNTPCDSTTSWIQASVSTPVVIQKGKWFKILMAADAITTPISNPYDNFYFHSIDVIKWDQISVDKLNKDVLPAVQSIIKSYPTGLQSYINPFYDVLSLIHFSDIHNKPTLWSRIGAYLDEHMNLFKAAIMTGDYCGDNLLEYTNMYNVFNPTRPVYMVVGNHDTYANANHDQATKANVHSKLFTNTSNWNATFMSGADSMSYYIDYPTSKIRLIVYDNYYDIASQLTWLTTVLNDAKSLGYSVITASHQVTSAPATKIDCTFQTLVPYENYNTGSVVDTPFDAIIGAFIAGGGKHIVHLCGHEHQDWFFKTSNNVLNCSIECATDYQGWTEGARIAYTKSWDCFNAISIDPNTNTIRIVRLGADVDIYNRTKHVLGYDYQNNRVLFNY